MKKGCGKKSIPLSAVQNVVRVKREFVKAVGVEDLVPEGLLVVQTNDHPCTICRDGTFMKPLNQVDAYEVDAYEDDEQCKE
jgi:hypothetical protein